ncbi:MAG: BatD family protein [Muribaculaceae bacterium]|nr:BatD family protein [Muribaculaceae bacterium]
MREVKVRLTLLLVMVAVAVSAFAGSVRLRVDIPRGKRSIGVGDLFYISYEVTDINKAPEKPAQVPGAKVMYFDRTGQSSRFSSVNGKTTQSFSYTYTLTLKAEEEGNFSFGPVTVDGVRSNSVDYAIGAATAVTPQPNSNSSSSSSSSPDRNSRDEQQQGPKFIGKGDGNLYLRASVSKSRAYQQEALVYTVKLYTTYDAIKFIGATAAPKFDGFVVEESKDISSSLTYETVNGKTYATAIIARYIIFPQLTGELKVSGNTYTVSVDEREYYHDPFWGNMSVAKPLQLNVTPNDLTVTSMALPSPQPADFSGAVGTFSITSDLPAAKYESNHASSIVYTVTGTGNIKYVKLPELNDIYPKELEVFTPTADVETTVGSSNVSGKVKFDYSFMPLETGTFQIPAIRFVYFNPSTGRYEHSEAKGYTISVGKGAASAMSQTTSNLAFGQNLMPVGHLAKEHGLYVRSVWYWLLLYVLPLAILVTLALVYRNYIKTHADMSAVRSRRASKMAQRRLKKAGICMRKGEREQFYDEMLFALWGYLSDKLKMPTSELTRDNIRVKLLDQGIESEQADNIIKLIDECEFAKYAPSASGVTMEDIYKEGVEAINGVEESLNRQKK